METTGFHNLEAGLPRGISAARSERTVLRYHVQDASGKGGLSLTPLSEESPLRPLSFGKQNGNQALRPWPPRCFWHRVGRRRPSGAGGRTERFQGPGKKNGRPARLGSHKGVTSTPSSAAQWKSGLRKSAPPTQTRAENRGVSVKRPTSELPPALKLHTHPINRGSGLPCRRSVGNI